MSTRRTVDFNLLDPDFLRPSFRVIEAGAGSGKTYNLEFLVLRLVAERAKPIGEIVLVTFTEAAAMEMRQRVRERLSKAFDLTRDLIEKEAAGTLSDLGRGELAALRSILDVQGAEEALRKQRVDAAVAQLSRLRVTTIHGFCQAALAEHAPNAGFPPLASAPVDGSELAEQIAMDWHRSRGGEQKLSECLKAVRAKMADPECNVSMLFRPLKDKRAGEAPAADASSQPQPASKAPGAAAVNDKSPGWLPDAKKLEKNLHDFIKAQRALYPAVTFDDLILMLKQALLEGSERAELLAAALRKQFTCCLIDEFQDTDDNQWAIFKHLFMPKPGDAKSEDMLLVVVGDPKQAIYGFRGADISAYTEAITHASDGGLIHTLSKNHRSSPSFIRAFNQIFARPGYFDGSLDYVEAKPVKSGDVFQSAPIQVIPSNDADDVPAEVARLLHDLDAIDKDAPAGKKQRRTVGVLVRSNADADAIHRALVEHRLPAALESTQSVFATQAAYLAQLLLQAVLESNDLRPRRALLYARPALFGDLTKALDGPGAEAALQLFDAELADWLAGCHRSWTKYGFPSMWSRLTRVSPSEGRKDPKKSEAQPDETAAAQPDEKASPPPPRLQSVQQSLAAAEFRSRLLVDLAHVGELLGARQRENLWDPHQVMEHLRLKIAGSESDGDVEDADASLDEALRPETARPRVLVQTIHKSKGLEYDAVVLYLKPDTRSRSAGGTVLRLPDSERDKLDARSRSTGGTVLRSPDPETDKPWAPLGKRALVLGGRSEDPTFAGLELGGLIEAQQRLEDARLLYVAITRAKHRLLVMTKDAKSPDKTADARESQAEGEGREASQPTEPPALCAPVELASQKAFHKVLAVARIHPFLWRPCDVVRPKPKKGEKDKAGESAASEDKKAPASTAENKWDLALVGYPGKSQCNEYADEVPAAPTAADRPKHIERIRGTTSFSVLTRDPHARADDDKVPDEGGVDIRRAPPRPDSDLLLDGRIKGALFGTFVHELLDGLDFKQAAKGRYGDGDLVNHVQDRLKTSGLSALDGDAGCAKLAAQVSKACQLWLKADLPKLDGADDFSLAEIESAQTLSEVRFALRADIRAGTLERIQQLFAEEFGGGNYTEGEGKEGPMKHVSLSGESVKGLLTGVADLIFEHGNRYYILDWKTNYLGDMVNHYDRKAVDAEVAGSQYHLQYSLYAAALDAYLSQALGGDWSYDRPAGGADGRKSFGGVYYLFLRAFGSDKTGTLGCHHYRPTRKFVSGLRDAITQSAPVQP